MRMCTSVAGGAMFIPEEIERKTQKASYSRLVDGKEPNARPKSFGKRKSQEKTLRKAA